MGNTVIDVSTSDAILEFSDFLLVGLVMKTLMGSDRGIDVVALCMAIGVPPPIECIGFVAIFKAVDRFLEHNIPKL